MPPASKQSKLSNFFASSSKAREADESATWSSDVDMDESAEEESAPKRALKKARSKLARMAIVEEDDNDAPTTGGKKEKYTPPEESSLPPLSNLGDIFADIIRRIPEIKPVAERVHGRKLRVATMCSGTESPLLALRMITRAMQEKYAVSFDIDHVFSCEIVPFKQAYIERNFHPPLLFRDVCELGDQYAHTAYGSKALVPGNVDLLIAGTSCVDYSNLNNEKKDIEAGGESGRTFKGMMQWVTKHRPPIVILENVCSAPWAAICKKFESIGYSAQTHRLDTKQYYIPHTRLRGYLVAVDRRKSSIPNKWVQRMAEMRREASVSLDAFLLESDDPRIHRAREKLVQESYNSNDRRTGRTDWARCESRHQRARLEEELGNKRPLTSWGEGNMTKLPDFAWSDWGKGQVERVWDLLDISLLRSAKQGIDPSFKSQVWNLSQNVDRSTGSNKVGISPCLTPSMIPYITNRGGPMVGLEALHFQGLPIDELLLTRETEDQEADLAGNAMSTTVVGTSMIIALALAGDLLIAGDSSETYEEKKGTEEELEASEDTMAVDAPHAQESVEDHISGYEQLCEMPLDLSSTADIPLTDILANAMQSVRLCLCEGRKDITTSEIRRCVDCGMTACVVCGGRPEHNYETMNFDAQPRLFPSNFARDLKSVLPMRLTFSGLDSSLLDQLREEADGDLSEKHWSVWRKSVLEAAASELQFVELKRQALWSATYESTSARLELELHPTRPIWHFYAKPSPSLPANAEIRKTLMLPSARFLCDGALFSGYWEVALPVVSTIDLTVEGVGDAVPSWEAKLGLQGDNFRNRLVWERLQISVADEDARHFDRSVAGVYTLLDKCGTANSALHKKSVKGDDLNQPPLFMLFDPSRCGKPEEDSFVFSDHIRRYEYGEARPITAKLDSDWRQSDKDGKQTVRCVVPQAYLRANAVRMTPSADNDATYCAPLDDYTISAVEDACKTANALLVAKVSLGDSAGPEWSRSAVKEVSPIEERAVFRSVSWLTERVKVVNETFMEWHDVDAPDHISSCERCAPKAPSIQWFVDGRKMLAIEDPAQAGEYERRLKRRPAPFVTQLKLDTDGTGSLFMGVNFTSLMHRAAARLPTVGRSEALKLSWRLNTDFMPLGKLAPAKFSLTSNRKDPGHSQPPHFKRYPLRREQLRSLHWMLAQESVTAPPFVEEEISEAILEPLGWRAEGRAQRPVVVRGGVLADEVGYGKTAISLGLIDCSRQEVRREVQDAPEMPGKIRVHATLCIVPPHLTKQWESETKKFISASAGFKLVRIMSAADINSLTIEEVQDADLVIIASTLFRSPKYLDNLAVFAAGSSLPSNGGRYFSARLDSILELLREQVDRLRDEGSQSVMSAIRNGRKAATQVTMKPSKRVRGIQTTDSTDLPSTSKATADDGKLTSNKPAAASGKRPNSLPRQVFSHVEVPTRASLAKAVDDLTSTEPSDDEKAHSKRRRASKAIVIDFDSEDDIAPSKKRRLNKAGAAHSSRSASPDFVPSDENEDEDYDEEAASDYDSDAPKGKGKSKGRAQSGPKGIKPQAKPKKKAQADTNDEDGTSASESAPNDPKKRKRADPKPKELREAKDPWKLQGAAKRSWTEMRAPPLEMFHFGRIVIDEYTYLDGMALSIISSLSADRHWVLSGTSPTKDFAALKTIARFLDVHLGIDDDGEGNSVKKRVREQTAAEQFHSFREAHSLDWHAHRNGIGQTFLDRFVRQNVAEIDEIKWEDHYIKVLLPAAERAIYLELEHHLRSLEMTIKRSRKNESDREKRLAKSLGESKTAEEALLKRCSHFELETSKQNAMRACDFIVQERERQLEECKDELVKTLKKALQMEKDVGHSKGDSESLFRESIRVAREKGVGDDDAKEIILQVFEKAGVTAKTPSGSGKSMKDADRRDLAWDLREVAHHIRKLIKELVGRKRSLRYFTVVRDLQKHGNQDAAVDCPGCGRDKIPIEEVAVLSSCGHTGCYTCIRKAAENEECVYFGHGNGSGCEANARVLNIVKGSTLGVDESNDRVGKRFGKKLEEVVNLIRDEHRVKKSERVLIFVQFPDLMKKVGEALSARGIGFLEIKGSAIQKSNKLQEFQNGSKERVLLLNVMDESASGANLTGANHAIFLSPLLTDSQEEYDACETQAIGRLRRFGQTQTVHIWRFLTMDTMDVEQFERRKGVKVADLNLDDEAAGQPADVTIVDSDIEMEE